jgi:hypothetical protein
LFFELDNVCHSYSICDKQTCNLADNKNNGPNVIVTAGRQRAPFFQE